MNKMFKVGSLSINIIDGSTVQVFRGDGSDEAIELSSEEMQELVRIWMTNILKKDTLQKIKNLVDMMENDMTNWQKSIDAIYTLLAYILMQE